MADQPRIMLNLDETPDDRGIEPYTFVLAGRTYQFTDPAVLDWQTTETLATLDALAEHCMSDEDRKAFYAQPLAAFKLNLLFEDVQRHFKLGQYASKRHV